MHSSSDHLGEVVEVGDGGDGRVVLTIVTDVGAIRVLGIQATSECSRTEIVVLVAGWRCLRLSL